MPPYLFDSLCWTTPSWTSASLNVGPTDTHSGDIQWHSSTKNAQSRELCGEGSCRGTAEHTGLCGWCVLTKKKDEKQRH